MAVANQTRPAAAAEAPSSSGAIPPRRLLPGNKPILKFQYAEVRQVQAALKRRTGAEEQKESPVIFYSQLGSLLGLLRSRLLQINSLIRVEEPRGWFGTPAPESQQTIHQRAVVAFLEHRLTLLTRRMEQMREVEEGETRRLQRIHQRRMETVVTKVGVETKPSVKLSFEQGQAQLLMQENEALKADLVAQQNALSQTERDIMEIASLQSALHSTLLHQADHIERLYEEAEETVDTMEKGNRILGKAGREQSGFTFFVILMIIAVAILLLAIHFAFD